MTAKTTALLIATLAALSGTAQAAFVSYSDATAASTATPIVAGHLTLAKFDSALGLLTGATFGWTGAVSQVVTISNDEDSAQNFQITGTATLDFGLPAGPQTLKLLSLGSQTVGALSTGPALTLTAAGSDMLVVDAADLLSLIGPGSLDILVNAQASAGIEGPGDYTRDVATTAKLGATVSYQYTPNAVPEPGALMLVGLALGAAALVSRRRKA